MRGNKQWPHANAKQQKDQVATLSSKLNTLSQHLDSIDKNTNPRGGGRSGKQPTCWGCGETGHIKSNCPNKDKWEDKDKEKSSQTPKFSGAKPWMFKAPAEGESEVKMVEGVEYKFCKHCKLGKQKKPMWDTGSKAHISSKCRTKKKLDERKATGNLLTIQEEPATETVDRPLTFKPFMAFT